MQKSLTPTGSRSSEGESSDGEEEQVVCIFRQSVWAFKNLCSQSIVPEIQFCNFQL